jgi:hypothetical protein
MPAFQQRPDMAGTFAEVDHDPSIGLEVDGGATTRLRQFCAAISLAWQFLTEVAVVSRQPWTLHQTRTASFGA